MNNSLAKRRAILSGVISVCAALMTIPVFCLAQNQPTETVKMIGMIVLCAVWYTLIGTMIFLNHSKPTARELLDAARAELDDLKTTTEKWASLEAKHMTFKELSWGERFIEIAWIAIGLIFVIYGTLDFLHFIPTLEIRGVDGVFRPVTNWKTAALSILLGFSCFLIAAARRIKLVDRWNERFKHFLQEVDEETEDGL